MSSPKKDLILLGNDDWVKPNNNVAGRKSLNNGYIRAPQPKSSMDDASGVLLDNQEDMETTNQEILDKLTPSLQNLHNQQKSVIVNLGPGSVTKTSIQPSNHQNDLIKPPSSLDLFKRSKLRNRLIVLACAFLVLGAAFGALTIYFAGYSYFSYECSSSSYGSHEYGNLGEFLALKKN